MLQSVMLHATLANAAAGILFLWWYHLTLADVRALAAPIHVITGQCYLNLFLMGYILMMQVKRVRGESLKKRK